MQLRVHIHGEGMLETVNWQLLPTAENAVPADGAKLVFPCIPGSGSVELTNDLSAKVKEISTVKQISNAPITPADSCKSYVIDKVDFQADVKFSGENVNAGDTPFVLIGSQTGIKNLSVDNSNVEFSRAVAKIHLDNFAITNQGCNERSEEYTSELQSPTHLVCRLLLEKKRKIRANKIESTLPP